MVKLTTVRLVLSLATFKKWNLHQLGVNYAFLHGDLDEEVYMSISSGFTYSTTNQVCKLQKSINGFKQTSRQWNEKLLSLLISLGYSQSKSDYSLLTKIFGDRITILIIYVDDVVLTGNDLADLGHLKFLFLGLEAIQTPHGLTLSQRKSTLEILQDVEC